MCTSLGNAPMKTWQEINRINYVLNIAVLWDVALCNVAERYQDLRGTGCSNLKVRFQLNVDINIHFRSVRQLHISV
jgi:hypothetical protein